MRELWRNIVCLIPKAFIYAGSIPANDANKKSMWLKTNRHMGFLDLKKPLSPGISAHVRTWQIIAIHSINAQKHRIISFANSLYLEKEVILFHSICLHHLINIYYRLKELLRLIPVLNIY